MEIKRSHIIAGCCAILLGFLFYLAGARPDRKETIGSNRPDGDVMAALTPFLPDSDREKNTRADEDEMLMKKFKLERTNLISDIYLEKTSVCTGEEVLVSVTGSNPFGPDSPLVYRIHGRPGSKAILRFKKPGIREFFVVASDPAHSIDMKKVSLEVKDCEVRQSVVVNCNLSEFRQDEVSCAAQVNGMSGKLVYSWDFGDSNRLAGDDARVTHNFFEREQKSAVSTFIVTVDVRDESGNEVRGRSTVVLMNTYFLASSMGDCIMPIRYDSFPVDDGSSLIIDAHMNNIYNEPVVFSRAELDIQCADPSQTKKITYSANALGLSGSVPQHEVKKIRLMISKNKLPANARNVIVRLSGSMPGGVPVSATLHLNIVPDGPAAVDRARDIVITDPDLIKRLENARTPAGRVRLVTHEQLNKLSGE